jgi:hypothetical protein
MLVTLFQQSPSERESIKVPAETADEHLKMGKQLRRMLRAILLIAFFADQQMIEELLKRSASISEILMFEGLCFL